MVVTLKQNTNRFHNLTPALKLKTIGFVFTFSFLSVLCLKHYGQYVPLSDKTLSYENSIFLQ